MARAVVCCFPFMLTVRAADNIVAFEGRSSMAIQMRAFQVSEEDPWLQATFTFVGRSFETGKAVAINPLLPETAQEKAYFEHAANQAEAKKVRA